MSEKFYTTPAFAKELGVSRQTIMAWESKGIVKPHHITPTRRRYYSQAQVDELLDSMSSANNQSN